VTGLDKLYKIVTCKQEENPIHLTNEKEDPKDVKDVDTTSPTLENK